MLLFMALASEMTIKNPRLSWVGWIEFAADVDELVVELDLCCGDEDIVRYYRGSCKGEGGLTLHAINCCGEGGDIVNKTDANVFSENNAI